MTDYVVAVGFQTDAGTVKRSTDQLAESVSRVGTAQGQTARSTQDLTSASSQLERMQQRIVLQQKNLAEATRVVERMQAFGATGSKQYTRALQEQLTAQDRLAGSILRMQKQQAPAPTRSRLGSNLVAGAAGYFTGQAIGKLATDSVAQAGALNQALQKNQQIFGAYAGEVEQIGKNSANALGLSKQAAIGAADTFGTLFQTLHVGQGEAAGMSEQLVKIGVNVAAFTRSSPSDVFNALRGGLNGQFSELQKYGVLLTTANVQQEAVRLGLVHGKEAMSQSARATAAYSLIVKQTADRQGAFLTNDDKIAQQQLIVKARLDDAKAALGQGLTPAYLALAGAAEHTVIPALSGVAKAVGFLAGNDTARHITEIALAAYAVNKAINAGGSFVDRMTASYVRLTGAAEGAAVAERAAANAARGGPSTPTPAATGIGAGPIVAAAAAGLTLATLAQKPTQALHDDGTTRGGGAGGVEKTVANILNATNGVTIVEHAWDSFKAKAKEGEAVVGDTASIDGFSAAYQRASTRVEALTAAQTRANRSLSYALRASQDTKALATAAANQPIAGLLDAPPSSSDIDLPGLRASVRSANEAVAIAQGRSAKGPSSATASQLASAEASVASARAAARKPGGDFDAEQARLRAAETRLAELRRGGTKDALTAAASEKTLEDARERQRKANENLQKGEQAVNGLSGADVLARADKSKATAQAEVRNVRRLTQAGLTSDVIDDLKKLESTAPGTLANVAKSLTPAFVKQLNHDAAARRKAAQDLAGLGDQAERNDALRRAHQVGKELGDAIAQRYIAALSDPKWRALAQTALAQLLIPGGIPGAGGAPGVPGKPAPKPGGPKTIEGTLFPPGPTTAAIPPGTSRHDLTGYHTAPTPTRGVTTSVVHLSPESTAAVGNAVRSGSSVTRQHQNVFPNVTNFPAAISAAERAERNSRIGGG